MRRPRIHRSIALPAALGTCTVASSAFAQGDPAVLAHIVAEGTQRSQAWSYLEYLSEDIGVRLTGSAALDRANAWTRDQFVALGLDARLEKWGEVPVRFDRGPSSVRMVAPVEKDLEFTARSWSAGTSGPRRGSVVKLPATMDAFEALEESGALEGAWVLSRSPARRRRGSDSDDPERALREEIDARLDSLPIAGRVLGARNDLVITSSERGWREMAFDAPPTDVTVTVRRADYDALNSRLADGEDVAIEVDLVHHFVEGPIPVYNTVAEIRGTDWPDEVVIVSGHLDTWDGPGSQGAQDNGTGCAVALEAARLLMTAGAQPRRTIRFVLWTGEEQGLLGSSAYVAGLDDVERDRISAVLVDDGGSGYCGGLVCTEAMVPMLAQASAEVNEAFPDMPIELIVRDRMPRGGGSDHVPFNREGIPGFFWRESGLGGLEGRDYRYIHHTQNDTMRYAVPEQLVQSAVASAVVAYNLACADTLLEREVPGTTAAAPPAPRTTTPEAVPASVAPEWTAVAGVLGGRWNAVLTGESVPADSSFTLTFVPDGATVRGALDSAMGGGTLERVQFDAAEDRLRFRFESEAIGTLDAVAKVEGNAMRGTLTIGDEFTIGFRAEREKDI